MKIFLAAAATAVFATGAMANDLFVDQSGPNNIIGSPTNGVQQNGANNTMDLTQSGPRNSIGGETWSKVRQIGDLNTTTIVQDGRDNRAPWVDARGNRNTITVRQPGHENILNQLEVNGNRNEALIRQEGNRNSGSATQVGDDNILIVRQDGNENDFDIYSGNYGNLTPPPGAPTWTGGTLAGSNRPLQCDGCTVNLRQSGSDNYALIQQEGASQNAQYVQSGSGNTAHSWQSNTRNQ